MLQLIFVIVINQVPKSKRLNKFEYDKDGIKYKHPECTCKECVNYPCFYGFENRVCDFAKYGCIEWVKK